MSYLLSQERRQLTKSYDKSPFINRTFIPSKARALKFPPKTFNYTTIAGRLRTVSCSNYCYSTRVVNWFIGPTFQLPAMCNQKDKLKSRNTPQRRSCGGVVVKLLAFGTWVWGSSPVIATKISDIEYLVLPSCNITEILSKRRKSSKQPNQLNLQNRKRGYLRPFNF